jgi:TrmH family RNA methyltransferase
MTASRSDLPPISSLEHPLVKVARSLHSPQGRRRHRACLVEGRRVVESASLGNTPSVVLHTATFGLSDAGARALLRRFRAAGVTIREVSDEVMATVSDTVQPQGIVAVIPLPQWPVNPESAWATPFVVILDAVADPGNAGTLVRVAAGVGASILATNATTDLWSPKVVRAGAGAHFSIPVQAHVAWEDVPRLLPRDTMIVATDSRAEATFWDIDLTGPVAIVVSNEAHGATDGARRHAHRSARIPQRTGDSLNAAVAGAVVLYEASRQRDRAGFTFPTTTEGAWN